MSQVLEKCKSDVDFFNLRVVSRQLSLHESCAGHSGYSFLGVFPSRIKEDQGGILEHDAAGDRILSIFK